MSSDMSVIDVLRHRWRRYGGGPYCSSLGFHLYGIQCAEGPIKLGRAINPEKRRKQIQTGFAEPIRIIATAPEYVVSEAEAHRRWRSIRIRSEWFEPRPDLVEWLHDIADLAARLAPLFARISILEGHRDHRQLFGGPLRHLAFVEHQLRRTARTEERLRRVQERHARLIERSRARSRGE